MSVFERNMRVLQGRYPALYRAVRAHSGEGYEVIPSTNGGVPNLLHRNETGGLLFYEPSDPLGHIREVLTDLRLERALIVVILGLGLGYSLNLLFSALRSPGPLQRIVVVERDVACLRRSLEVLDLTEALSHEGVKLIVGAPEEDLYIELWNALAPAFGGLKALKFVPWPASIRQWPEYYRGVKRAVQDVAQSFLAERGNDPYDNLVAYENFFENLPLYLSRPGLHHVKGLFSGRPAVVVAAGPSLNRNVHLLRSMEDRAVILSADASLKVLSEAKVTPHFATTVERTPGTEKFFEGVSGLESVILAVASFIYPKTLASYPGPLLFLHRRYHFYETLGIDADSFEMGGTTAHCAFALARHMGCNPIVFVGQDLAYGPDGITHARGCTFGQRQSYAVDAERIAVPANGGGMVWTCPLWLRLLREYERTLSGFEGLAVNATEGGARIRGTTVMTLREAMDRFFLEEFAPRETAMKALQGKRPEVSPSLLLERLEGLEEEARHVLEGSRRILGRISPVLRRVEAIQGEIPDSLAVEILSASREVNALADGLMTAPLFRSLGEYFMAIWVPLLMEWQVVDERFRKKAWADAYRLQLGEEGFGAMGQLCLSLTRAIEMGKERLRSLIERENGFSLKVSSFEGR